MTKHHLIATAKALMPPPSEVADEFASRREHLAYLVNQSISVRPDMEKLVGEGNRLMTEDNNRNFARFMESIFYHYQAEVLVETVLWVFRAYRSHGFQTTYWPANLSTWVELLRKELPAKSFEAIYPFYNWLIINIPTFVRLTASPPESITSEAQHPDA
jgi:hypothetical protein